MRKQLIMIEHMSTPYNFTTLSTKPLQVTLEVEKQSVTMEVDTGAAVSLMLKEEDH